METIQTIVAIVCIAILAWLFRQLLNSPPTERDIARYEAVHGERVERAACPLCIAAREGGLTGFVPLTEYHSPEVEREIIQPVAVPSMPDSIAELCAYGSPTSADERGNEFARQVEVRLFERQE